MILRQRFLLGPRLETPLEIKVSLHDYRDLGEAHARIGHLLDDVYVTTRIHSSLGSRTPAELEAAFAGDRHEGLDAGIEQGYGGTIIDLRRFALGER